MTFCFLREVTWADDQLTLSKTLGKPFASIRKNPKVFMINIPDSGSQATGWTTLSLASATTPATNLVFLSVWARAHEENQDGTEGDSFGWVGIRPPAQTEFVWQRPVGQIYSQQLIYMDVTDPNPLYLLLCPTNESQEIEYYYTFAPNNPSAQLDYQFEITVLGYLEGEWQ